MKPIFIQTQRERGSNRHLDHENAQPINAEGCHPALTQDAQVALPLREVCDLTTEEIARTFLITPYRGATRRARQEQDPRPSHSLRSATHKEDLAPEEIRQRAEEMFIYA